MDGENEGERSGGVSPVSEKLPPLFPRLVLLHDTSRLTAAEHMARDRQLLETATEPLLRVYHWAAPCATIGYFSDMPKARAAYPGLEVARRWTGGGTVLHGDDAPYSLIVPRGEALAALRPAESYALIHGYLASTLSALSGSHIPPHELTLQTDAAPKLSEACFENPVKSDVMAGLRKIAGAAQRRTRHGFLHQGSIHIKGLELAQFIEFARAMCDNVSHENLCKEI